MKMAFNIGEIKSIDLIGFLKHIGIEPVSKTADFALYHAPYRKDERPSFRVSRKKNKWYDYATMASGDIIDLGKLIYNTNDFFEVLRRIQNYTSVQIIIKNDTVAKNDDGYVSPFKDIQVLPLTHPKLLGYLASRGIDDLIAQSFCKEIHYTMGRKAFYGIAFANIQGGFEVRNPFWKGCVGKKDITLIKTMEYNEFVTVFEGFMDFLSFLVLFRRGKLGQITETMDYLILNSVSNLGKARKYLEAYQTITCCLDNDDAGRRAVDTMSELFKCVHDVSDAYKGFKDLNDFLRGKHFCP